jgi:endonuclease/exonuclease/phosphatase family metal-dependent hydrolase
LFLSLKGPAILMGDFNITIDENGHAIDADVAALASTPGVIDPIGKNYDRIFARGFVAVNSGFVEEHASDHPMAWAELQLEQPQTAANSPPTLTTEPKGSAPGS